jgi:hypothetical protein
MAMANGCWSSIYGERTKIEMRVGETVAEVGLEKMKWDPLKNKMEKEYKVIVYCMCVNFV